MVFTGLKQVNGNSLIFFRNYPQYKLLCTILNKVEVYEEPVLRTKKSLTVQLNSRPVRKIELYTNVCIELCSVGIVGRSGFFVCYSLNLTRFHSSRMRTVRALTISPSMLCTRGEGGSGQGFAWSGGCLLLGGGGIPACTEVDPTCEQNHTRL